MAEDEQENEESNLREEIKKIRDRIANIESKSLNEQGGGSADGSGEGSTLQNNTPITNEPGRIRRTGRKLWGGSKWTGRKLWDGAKSFNNAPFKLFFWLTLLWHAIDAYTFWATEKTGFIPTINKTAFIVYLIIAVLAWILLFRYENTGALSSLGKFLSISFLCIALPAMTTFFPNSGPVFLGLSLPELARAVLLIAPLWPVYLANHYNYELGSNLLKILWGALLIFVIILTVIDSSLLSNNLMGEGGGRAPAAKVWEIITDGFSKTWQGIIGIPGNVTRQIRLATDPQYESQVEQNEYGPLGVQLESLQTTSKNYFKPQNIDAFVTIKGQTFTGWVVVENSCYLESQKNEGKIPKGYDTFTITNYDVRQIPCSFGQEVYENIDLSKKTAYQVYFSSKFNFETWGYLTYSFIDRNIRDGFLNEKKDIYQFYGLDRLPKAVYTSGPVELGLVDKSNPLSMPYSIDPDNPILPLFGITIKNKDPYGKVIRINELEFKLPTPLKIKKDSCTPTGRAVFSYPEKPTNGFYTYSLDTSKPMFFSRDETYITIQCIMELEQENNKPKVGEFLGQGGVSINTLSARVNYDYEIIKSTPISIKEGLI